MEIVSGLQRMQSPRRIQKFMNNISGEEVLPFDEAAGKLAGEIAGDLERTGQSLGIADPMIAAIALRHGLELVNALPPPKWGSFWANPAIAELQRQGLVPVLWTQVDPVVFSLLRRAALVDPQRPCGCAWGDTNRMVEDVSRRARSVDVFQRGRFLFPRQPLTSPLPKNNSIVSGLRAHCQRRLQ